MTVKETLFRMVDMDRIPHAIMLSEHDGGGAVGLCVDFLKYLYCHDRHSGEACSVCPSCNKVAKLIHPDIHFIFPTASKMVSESFIGEWRELVLSNPKFTEAQLAQALGIDGKSSMIAVSEAKAMLSTLSLSALEGGYRAVVIYLPEKMNPDASNRLLKIIEEPPAKTQFLLVTHAPDKVLKTISSRCQTFQVTNDASTRDAEFTEPELMVSLMESLVRKDLLSSLEAGDELVASLNIQTAKAFCRYAADSMRRMFMVQQGLDAIAHASSDEVRWAGMCRKTFPRKAMEALDRAHMLIDRNVNLKIVFTDLIDRLIMMI